MMDTPIKICPNDTEGEVVEIEGLKIQLPKKPLKKDIWFSDKPKAQQHWRTPIFPKELTQISGQDEFNELPAKLRETYSKVIREDFRRRRDGVWFMNNGHPTYITGNHYFMLTHYKLDIGHGNFLQFQRKLFLHWEACNRDGRSIGQVFTKCRRSGYSNMSASILLNDGSQVKDKHLGIVSKTGDDAKNVVFISKVVNGFRNMPWWARPIFDGTTNPRAELAFRTPSKRVTKKSRTIQRDEALNTIIDHKNTTTNAYDGSKLYRLLMDEAGKWETCDLQDFWRINRTCLIVGRRIVGKALVGSTVNPMSMGGSEFKKLVEYSNPGERNENGRTKSGLYSIFIPAYEALEGFFDKHGNPIIDDPKEPVQTIDGDYVSIGAKTFLKNEREALKGDAKELNEFIRQFPFTMDEAFRDSLDTSTFNVAKIYDQLDYNSTLYPFPTRTGNFVWKNGEKDTEVVFMDDPNGKFNVSWLPPTEIRNKKNRERGQLVSPNDFVFGGVDSYDIDETTDNRGSNGAFHLYTGFNMSGNIPSNQFVLEYATRPPLARIFYEDVLMATFYYGAKVLIENNKYGIARHFESRGYMGYLMDRPKNLSTGNSNIKVKTKGIPSNSAEIIQSHAQAIESYIHHHVGYDEEGNAGKMFFDRTLNDWINYRITKRTKYDLTISSGLALLASQNYVKPKPPMDTSDKQFFRRFKFNS